MRACSGCAVGVRGAPGTVSLPRDPTPRSPDRWLLSGVLCEVPRHLPGSPSPSSKQAAVAPWEGAAEGREQSTSSRTERLQAIRGSTEGLEQEWGDGPLPTLQILASAALGGEGRVGVLSSCCPALPPYISPGKPLGPKGEAAPKPDTQLSPAWAECCPQLGLVAFQTLGANV